MKSILHTCAAIVNAGPVITNDVGAAGATASWGGTGGPGVTVGVTIGRCGNGFAAVTTARRWWVGHAA
ncbi:MAG TPA: hypothetical protein VGN35_01445 [Jatrophihabitantaceae bacterium]|nr:hypothetical protein [Jatrophihabitantaceae bacterium]